NTFDVVPDAPVSKFTLTMAGGKKGLLVNSRNLCAKPSYVNVKLTGQNGKRADQRVQMLNDCARKGKKGKRPSAASKRPGSLGLPGAP
ncbi:MAG TPA: hypothetical protein VEW07_08310, partial [Solirubrobacterales bacterium]|nr:hypothetical protein [Solirubrobacterales bacterium]